MHENESTHMSSTTTTQTTPLTLMQLLPEGETAYIALERARLFEERAKMAVEQAKADYDTARGLSASANAGVQEVFSKAEQNGLPRRTFKSLVEDRVTALLNSDLFRLDEVSEVVTAVTVPKVRQTRVRNNSDATTAATGQASAQVHTPDTDTVNAPAAAEHIEDNATAHVPVSATEPAAELVEAYETISPVAQEPVHIAPVAVVAPVAAVAPVTTAAPVAAVAPVAIPAFLSRRTATTPTT